jgi:hypothetical protein
MDEKKFEVLAQELETKLRYMPTRIMNYPWRDAIVEVLSKVYSEGFKDGVEKSAEINEGEGK